MPSIVRPCPAQKVLRYKLTQADIAELKPAERGAHPMAAGLRATGAKLRDNLRPVNLTHPS